MMKKVFHLTLDILLKVLAVIISVVVIASFFGFKVHIVQSGSMEPVIKTGSLVVVNENARYDDVEVGDIVAFKTATGAKVTHRVIAVTPEGFETKGDNNNGLSDGVSTTRSNFWGVTYEFCIPELGYAMASLNNGNTRLVIVLIGIALILLDLLLDTAEDTKKEEVIQEEVEQNTLAILEGDIEQEEETETVPTETVSSEKLGAS